VRARAVVTASLLAALAGCGGGKSGGASVTPVTVADFSFAPTPLHVPRGATVAWTNSGHTDHTVKGRGFFSRAIDPGASYRHRFDKPGTYAYICTLHPDQMRATVVVAPR
jgi:plastocyanin